MKYILSNNKACIHSFVRNYVEIDTYVAYVGKDRLPPTLSQCVRRFLSEERTVSYMMDSHQIVINESQNRIFSCADSRTSRKG